MPTHQSLESQKICKTCQNCDSVTLIDVHVPAGITCCAEEGVPNVCFGYCEGKEVLGRFQQGVQLGVCGPHFPAIGKCKENERNKECCRAKQVPRLCLGYCTKRDKTTSAAQGRQTMCSEFKEQMESCMSPKLTGTE